MPIECRYEMCKIDSGGILKLNIVLLQMQFIAKLKQAIQELSHFEQILIEELKSAKKPYGHCSTHDNKLLMFAPQVPLMS